MKLFSRIGFSFILLVTAAVLPVFAATAFLENYAQMRPGKYLDKCYFDTQALREKSYLTLAVKDIDVCQIKDSWGLKSEDAASYLKRELQEAARQLRIERFFVFETSDHAQAALEMAITRQGSGSPMGRLFGSVLGMGQAYFRIEGRIRDLQSNRIIASFSHATASKAVWPLRDFAQDGGMVMLKEMYGNISNEIMREIGDSFGYIPEIYRDGQPFKYS